MLPEQFLIRMKSILGGEYQDFLESCEKPPCQSLRVNRLKGSAGELSEKMGYSFEPVAWNEDGYYYKEDLRPGRHPFHEAGAYYIQEASAMLPAAKLDIRPGETVLDLCAAPGGKSTQIAVAMAGSGLLISNEIHPGRAKILSENIERMGIRNALVTCHEPAALAERFPGYFDKILVDAPCSGEGMFRKNAEAISQWSPENVIMCAGRQREILESAALMLKDGGRMVYSTCTFSTEENEENVDLFLKKHPEFTLEDTIRLWPHKIKGEGHFAASLKKQGEGGAFTGYGGESGIPQKDCGPWLSFREEYLRTDFHGVYVNFGSQLYLLPEGAPSLKGMKALRPGLHLGTIKKNRFEPAHALALALKAGEAAYSIDLSLKDAEKYISGQCLYMQDLPTPAQGEKGWYLLTVCGYSLGWGKLSGGMMKNHYPKGLRK